MIPGANSGCSAAMQPVLAGQERLSLRLGIDGEALRAPLSGVGNYVFNLCRELEKLLPHARLFAYARLPETRLLLPSKRWVVRTEANPTLRRLPSFVWLKLRGSAMCEADRLHVFWAGRTLHPRLPRPTRTVCTVHDLNHVLVPDTMQAATLWSHRLWFNGDVVSADRVVANSQGTAQRVNSLLRRAADAVVMPGLQDCFRPPTPDENSASLRELEMAGVRPPYLLSVATFEPRKNLHSLIDAFVGLRRLGKLRGFKLVLAGAHGWKRSAARPSSVAHEEIVETGYMPGHLLPALYANAEAFVMPSLYEGFGMPALEARACGTRVVASDTPELRDAAGPNAIFVEPTPQGVGAGIELALATPRVVETGLTEQHAWSRMAAEFVGVIVSSAEELAGAV